ncbi:MAG: ABC transporter permease [Saprospiraceae bacterium]|nr:ABC transporter permease [Saprospiraceae bacterium]
MLRYLIRRIALAIPTLAIISLIAFSMSRLRTIDPVKIEYWQDSVAYLTKARKLGLDQPQFYFSLSSAAFPATWHQILPLETRRHLEQWVWQTGNWPATQRFWHSITSQLTPALQPLSGPLLIQFKALRNYDQLADMPGALADLQRRVDTLPDLALRSTLQVQLDRIQHDYQAIASQPQQWKLYVPVLYWYGLNNQYHQWAGGFVTGDPGVSSVTGNPLLTELRPRLLTTLIVNGWAMLLAYLIGVPLGVFMARRQSMPFDKWASAILMFLYAMPVMWLGSLLVLLLSRQDIGLGIIDGLNAEPWLLSGKTYAQWAWDSREQFVLPVLTLTVHSLAILAMQMRGGVLEVVKQDYIRTARAKGLSETLVYWRHAFRNALFPIITIFATYFPALFSGSLVVEYLLNFPGMGTKMESAFNNNDYSVLFAMVLFVAFLTVLGNLVADMLFAWADPRVRFARR